MNSVDIEQFFARKAALNKDYVKITFKKRAPIYGMFLKEGDYNYLKTKNFWRIVTQSRMDDYKVSKNVAFARLFNGDEFSRLATYKESFE